MQEAIRFSVIKLSDFLLSNIVKEQLLPKIPHNLVLFY